MMSYIDVNWDFSQFDRDNSARHHAAGYALIANRIAADVLRRPRPAQGAQRDLAAADRGSRRRRTRSREHDYDGMLRAGRRPPTGTSGPARPRPASVRCASRARGRWPAAPKARG